MQPLTILVLSANVLEHHAVLKNVATRERYVCKNEAYVLGTLKGLHHDFQLILREPGKYPSDLTANTLQAIHLFQPHFAFLLSLATGTGVLLPGDVLISNRILANTANPGSKKKAARWLTNSLGDALLQSQDGLDHSQDSSNPAPGERHYPGALVSDARLISNAKLKNQAEILAVAPDAEGFFHALQSSPEVPGLALLGINRHLEEKDGHAAITTTQAVSHLTRTALELWRQIDCKEFRSAHMDCKQLAQDVFSRLFPFPEAVREIDHDFSSGFNKNYHKVWNLVKPLLKDEIFAFQKNPKDWDNQTGVREKLRSVLQDKKQLRHSLETLLKQAAGQPMR